MKLVDALTKFSTDNTFNIGDVEDFPADQIKKFSENAVYFFYPVTEKYSVCLYFYRESGGIGSIVDMGISEDFSDEWLDDEVGRYCGDYFQGSFGCYPMDGKIGLNFAFNEYAQTFMYISSLVGYTDAVVNASVWADNILTTLLDSVPSYEDLKKRYEVK